MDGRMSGLVRIRIDSRNTAGRTLRLGPAPDSIWVNSFTTHSVTKAFVYRLTSEHHRPCGAGRSAVKPGGSWPQNSLGSGTAGPVIYAHLCLIYIP